MEIKNKRSREETFHIVLKLQDEGLTRNEIKDKLGYAHINNVTRIMKKFKHKFSEDLGRYVEDNNVVKVDKSTIVKADDNSMTTNITNIDDTGMTIGIHQDLQNNIIYLANNYERIQRVLDWFENKDDDKGMTDVIEVISGIKIDVPESETVRTTIRINKTIWDNFDKFCQDNGEFKKQDLIAQALSEYMDRNSR